MNAAETWSRPTAPALRASVHYEYGEMHDTATSATRHERKRYQGLPATEGRGTTGSTTVGVLRLPRVVCVPGHRRLWQSRGWAGRMAIGTFATSGWPPTMS